MLGCPDGSVKNMEKDKGGRPAHEPTEATRKLCLTLSGYGVPQEEIGRQIGIHQETLRIHYRAELDSGVAQANARVAEGLYKKALSDGPQSASAAMFWLKTRAGWKETTNLNHTGEVALLFKTVYEQAPDATDD
jgi:hypothetical protein